MVRTLSPWFENISKRQVKSPKVYFRDSGILHVLLNTKSLEDIRYHSKVGASWEGFVLKQILSIGQIEAYEGFFLATQASVELDLLICENGKKLGFEIKCTIFPKITPAMKIVLED